MKYRGFFATIILLLFCTERLERFFYIGFFDLYPSRAIFLLLLPFFDYRRFIAHSSREVRTIFRVVIAYIVAVLFSALASSDVSYSLKKWLDSLTVFFFMFLVYSFLQTACKRSTVERIHLFFIQYLKIIILIVFVGALLLVRQIDDGGSVRTFAGLKIFRRISVFKDANFFCTFLAMAFSVVYFLREKNRQIFLLIILCCILLTGSKGGMLSLLIAFLYYFRRNIPFLKFRWIPSVSVACLSLLLMFAVFEPIGSIQKVTSHPVFRAENGDGTILPRIIAWSTGVKAFMDSPFLGIGPGNIVNVKKGSKNLELLSFVEREGFYGLGSEKIDVIATHSNYFEILIEHGLIAFCFFLMFVYKIMRLARRAIALDSRLFPGFYLAFCAFFLSTVLLSYIPFYVSFLFGLFFFLHDRRTMEIKLATIAKLSIKDDKV